ncbi:MAG: methyltransferase domain-containing protein [Syntrophothermus sp.]
MRQLSAETVFAGRIFDVVRRRYRRGDGRGYEREVVQHPGAVGIVAHDDRFVHLVRQPREAVGEERLLEIPAGTLDVEGETELECAQRELAEEVGLAAERWESLRAIYPTPGWADETTTIFLATGLREVEAEADHDEEIEVVRWPLDDLGGALAEAKDAKTLVGLLLLRDRLGSREGQAGDGSAPGYGTDLAAIHASGFTAIAEAAARELIGRLPERARVLDLGCGDGTSAALLAREGHAVHGIDLSPAAIELARKRAPAATFEVGSFLDAPLPRECDAVLAAGEVLGYRLDDRIDPGSLEAVLERLAAALRPGGILLFDLASPARAGEAPDRGWTEGDGWAVLVETEASDRLLSRRIVTFRDLGGGRFRRGEETHALFLHEPSEVLALLRANGLAGQVLTDGYDHSPLPTGLNAFIAKKTSQG